MMTFSNNRYTALISSDWNECLAPCGPFDAIAFSFPHLKDALQLTFLQYTSGRITLNAAVRHIEASVPHLPNLMQMDAYLAAEFKTYRNVARLIRWCADHAILFMINTTGMRGYFQRVFAQRLLPRVPVLSAHPMLSYSAQETDAPEFYQLREVTDKSRHTQQVMARYQIPSERVVIMGDSGGDGPHFAWGRSIGARLIGSMTKASLLSYCRARDIKMDLEWGISYGKGAPIDRSLEMAVDFMELAPIIETWFK